MIDLLYVLSGCAGFILIFFLIAADEVRCNRKEQEQRDKENRLRDIEGKLAHLMNMKKAEELLKEAESICPGTSFYYSSGSKIGAIGSLAKYSLDEFELKVLGPARKLLLETLLDEDKKKRRNRRWENTSDK